MAPGSRVIRSDTEGPVGRVQAIAGGMATIYWGISEGVAHTTNEAVDTLAVVQPASDLA